MADHQLAGLRKERIFIADIDGVDRGSGALVVVRPDQYVATVLPLDDFAALASYFDRFMLQAN